MDHFTWLSLFAIFFLAREHVYTTNGLEIPFAHTYHRTWGDDHLAILSDGREVRLKLDQYKGAGFTSNQAYGSGYFGMRIKAPKPRSQGTITAFYLTSVPDGQKAGNHFEFDIELLGGNTTDLYILSTNVFANDIGHREQQFHLWFDPTANFHTYQILWNNHQILFLVDKIPVRVYKNDKQAGVVYPTNRQMWLEASLWNFTSWLGPVNWSSAPFFANYRGFQIDGCPYYKLNPSTCDSPKYYWNQPAHWQLSPSELKIYNAVRKKYMVSNYCDQEHAKFPECKNEQALT